MSFTVSLPKDEEFTVKSDVGVTAARITFTSKTEAELVGAANYDQAAGIAALAGFEFDFDHTEGEGKEAIDVTYSIHGERIETPVSTKKAKA